MHTIIGNATSQGLRREDKVIAEMEALKQLYGDQLPPYISLMGRNDCKYPENCVARAWSIDFN